MEINTQTGPITLQLIRFVSLTNLCQINPIMHKRLFTQWGCIHQPLDLVECFYHDPEAFNRRILPLSVLAPAVFQAFMSLVLNSSPC